MKKLFENLKPKRVLYVVSMTEAGDIKNEVIALFGSLLRKPMVTEWTIEQIKEKLCDKYKAKDVSLISIFELDSKENTRICLSFNS